MPLVWEDPPERRRAHRWGELVAELREHPGVWARVFEDDDFRRAEELARYLRRSYKVQCKTRRLPGGVGAVWARCRVESSVFDADAAGDNLRILRGASEGA